MRIRRKAKRSGKLKCIAGALVALSALLSGSLRAGQSGQLSNDREIVELQYHAELTKLGFPNPLLKATLEGQTVWFIVDTGASVHTFAKWFVKAAGLKTLDTESTVTGSLGKESTVSVVRKTSLHLPDHRSEIFIAEAIEVDFPHIFEEHRIGGLISPQLLAPPGKSVLLNLDVPRLSFSDSPAALKETNVCTNRDSQFANRLYAVEITVANAKASFLVDTGATTTVLSAASAAASSIFLSQQASSEGHAEGVGGNVNTIRKTEPLRIELPGVSKSVSVSVGLPSVSCGRDGLLGMDVLRGCLLNLGNSSFSWSCR